MLITSEVPTDSILPRYSILPFKPPVALLSTDHTDNLEQLLPLNEVTPTLN